MPPVTVTLPGEPPRSFGSPREAIRWLLTLVESDQLGCVKLCDVHGETLRRTVGAGARGTVGSGAVNGKVV